MRDEHQDAVDATPDQDDAAQKPQVPVVGIGASAGGFEPLRNLLADVPAECGLAFVAVQHLAPQQESHLADLLARRCALPVTTAEDGERIEPNHIYAIPVNCYVVVEGGRLRLKQAALTSGRRMPIDALFRSLAEERGERSIAVVLSGTGSDGSQGVCAVRRAGGVVVVQDPETAQYADMPQSAIHTGMVDAVLPVDAMADFIVQKAKSAVAIPRARVTTALGQSEFDRILSEVALHTQTSFHGYKRSTIVRRALRRMGLNQLSDPAEYIEFLRRNPDEAKELRNDLLIGVTGFFREPDAWDALREQAVAPLVRSKSNEESVRIWVPGCATGEEAYSFAILLHEEMEREQKHFSVSLFASDIDEHALGIARRGEYGAEIEEQVSEERRLRFFTASGGRYVVKKSLRESIVFSRQDLILDPPFSRLDIISCRNVLIYLQPDIQKKIVSLFAFALLPSGILFLGKSDGIGARDDLFETVSKKARIFRKRPTAKPTLDQLPRSADPERHKEYWEPDGADRLNRGAMLSLINQQAIAEHFNAVIVLADMNGKILHLSGEASRYLSLPSGEADLDVLRMARGRLGIKLRPALHKIAHGEDRVGLRRVSVERDGKSVPADVDLRAVRPHGWRERVVAIIIEDSETHPDGGAAAAEMSEGETVRQLENELKDAQEELSNAYEEFETSNEELRAANEEVMSMNEELQSSNEELETSKEELQSVNEELSTVNTQLNEKVDELSVANNDLANLLNAARMAVIFLDENLRVKRFTTEATELFNLLDNDVGRPLTDLAQKFQSVDVAEAANAVLETLEVRHEEVLTKTGAWCAMRILPYRTLENRICGVVVTFNDITHIKMSEQFAFAVIDAARHPLLVLDRDLRVHSANPAFRQLCAQEEGELTDRRIYDICAGQWDTSAMRELLEKTLPATGAARDCPLTVETASGTKRMLVDGRCFKKRPGREELILLAMVEACE